MFKKIYFLTMVGILMSCSQTGSQNLKIEEYHLKNGLHVVIAPTNSRFATVTIQYGVGGAFETQNQLGLSHLLEHLMFKTSKHLKTGEFNYILENQLGGSFNAMTSYDSTIYHETVLGDFVPKVLDLEAERMVNLVLDPDEVAKEKLVVLEEMRNRIENNNFGFLLDKANHIFYGSTYPYGRDLGGRDNIIGISNETIHQYYAQHYAPNNATLIVSGNIIPSLKKDIEKSFGELKSGNIQKRETENDFTPTVGKFKIDRPVTSNYVLMLKKIPKATSKLTHGLNVLSYLLTNGSNSLLVQELVQKSGLVSSVSSSADTSQLPSAFMILFQPYQSTDIDQITEKIDVLLKNLAHDPELDKKIRTARLSMATDYFVSLQDTADLGVSIAQGISIAHDPLFLIHLQSQDIEISEIQKAIEFLLGEKWGIFTMVKK